MAELKMKVEFSPHEVRKALVGICEMCISSLEAAKCRILSMSDEQIAAEIEKHYNDSQES